MFDKLRGWVGKRLKRRGTFKIVRLAELPHTEYGKEALKELYVGNDEVLAQLDQDTLEPVKTPPLTFTPTTSHEKVGEPPNQFVMASSPHKLDRHSRQKAVRDLARYHGYEEEVAKDTTLMIFNRGTTQVNVWWTTMTVGTCLEHPSQGKTQLFRKGVDFKLLDKILDNPRLHTGIGYKQK